MAKKMFGKLMPKGKKAVKAALKNRFGKGEEEKLPQEEPGEKEEGEKNLMGSIAKKVKKAKK